MSLGDATSMNYVNRVKEDISSLRIYGSVTCGACGYLIGFVNEKNPYFPDYVPGLMLYCVCLTLSAIIIYVSPDEYFKMMIVAEDSDSQKSRIDPLPTGRTLWLHIRSKLLFGMVRESKPREADRLNQSEARPQVQLAEKNISLKQQLQILTFLFRRNPRILLSLFVVFYGSFTANSALNYVFTYLNENCRSTSSCSGAQISSMMMVGFCIVESLSYKTIEKLHPSVNSMLMCLFASLTFHYYFYGFLIAEISPYWFLIESLNGVEYVICLVLTLNFGYTYATRVDLILPDLIEAKVISGDDKAEQESARVCLIATMSSLFMLVLDGLGGSVGALVYGQIAAHYSYQVMWISIGTFAALGFLSTVLFRLVESLRGLGASFEGKKGRLHPVDVSRPSDYEVA